MPPGPAYNFLCVLSSVADILSHAARIKAAQTAASTTVVTSTKRKRRKLDLEANVDVVDVGKLAKIENAQSSPARKEKAIQKDASVHQSGYPVTAAKSLSDLPSSESPEDRVHTYEHAPNQSIPESQPRGGFPEGTLSPNDILPKAFEPHEVDV